MVLQASVALSESSVEGLRVWRAPDNTRIVFDLSDAVAHKIFPLKSPARLVIDIENASNKADLSSFNLEKLKMSQVLSRLFVTKSVVT